MKRTAVLLGALCVALAAAPARLARAEEAPAPTAEQILDAYVDATGGKEAYARIQNRVTRGRMEITGQDIELRVTIWAARPNKTYLTIDSEVTGPIERGTLGDLAWENSAMMGPQIKQGQEKADLLREANFDRWPAWRDVYEKVDLAGIEPIKERPAYKIVATPKDGDAETLWFDRETKLLVRQDQTLDNAMGRIPVCSSFEDYRKVDGILVPFGATTEMMGQTLALIGESVEHNVELPPDRFEPPAAIRERLKEAAKPAEKPSAEKPPAEKSPAEKPPDP